VPQVQHAGLREACASDMLAVSLAVRFAEWLFPEAFKLGWRVISARSPHTRPLGLKQPRDLAAISRRVLSELAPHLPLELDFEHEAQNAARCAAFFSATGGGAALAGRVVVPEARRDLPARAGPRFLVTPRDLAPPSRECPPTSWRRCTPRFRRRAC
jgi:hypothetical protein